MQGISTRDVLRKTQKLTLQQIAVSSAATFDNAGYNPQVRKSYGTFYGNRDDVAHREFLQSINVSCCRPIAGVRQLVSVVSTSRQKELTDFRTLGTPVARLRIIILLT